MTHRSGYFRYESIVYVALAVLVVTTLSLFAHAALSPIALA